MLGSNARIRWTTLAAVGTALVVAACGAFGSATDASSNGDAGSPSDGAVDAPSPDVTTGADGALPVANCNERAFGAPVYIPATSPLLSARLGGDNVLYVSVAGATTALGITTFIGGGLKTVQRILEPPGDDEQPMLSSNGLGLVFQTKRADPLGPYKLWYAARANPGAEFAPVGAVPFTAPLDAGAETQDPWLTDKRLYFALTPTAGGATRLQVGELDPGTATITNVRDLFSSAQPKARHPVLSHDELEMFYSDGGKVLRTTRASTTDAFKGGAVVPELVGSAAAPTWISTDGCDLYYLAVGGAGSGLFKASR